MSSGDGHGLNKPANARYFTLRFPRVLKIYDDRSFKDTVSFEELQEMARQCREVSEDGKREEVHWLSRLRSLPVVTAAHHVCIPWHHSPRTDSWIQ
jgi:hypothetical protein